MVHLVVQSFGRESELRRATVTILSYFAYSSSSIESTKVWLFTDQPNWFDNYLEGLPVTFIHLTAEKMKRMRGRIDFLHYIKISLIEEVFNQTNEPLLYVDSDSFFISDPQSYLKLVSENKSFMHIHEYPFEHLQTMVMPAAATFHEFLELIKTRKFQLVDGSTLEVTPKHSSWNAGVMILHQDHKKLIPDVFTLTEQFYPPTKNHASEQYAFSLMLQTRTVLESCEQMVYHYWYRTKKQIMDIFLDRNLSKISTLPLDKKLDVIKGWTKQLPNYFQNHLLTYKDNSIQLFNQNEFREALKWSIGALSKGAIADTTYVRDIFYHLRRNLVNR